MEYLILTNNSSLEAKAHGLPVKQVSGGVEDMYDAVGEHLQNGYALVSSPLPANVPLMTLEKARDRTKVLGVIADERTRADLEFIDKDQLARAVAQLKELGLA